jgi:hypothetical protein
LTRHVCGIVWLTDEFEQSHVVQVYGAAGGTLGRDEIRPGKDEELLSLVKIVLSFAMCRYRYRGRALGA